MQQIADWLSKLDLGQYAQHFADNDIDFSILADLTDQDLKELGVSSLGHRRQLLRAIAEINGVEKSPAKPVMPAATAAPPQPHDTAERRHLTVMFCDLVGSTGDFRATRCRGVARPRRRLSRCRLGGGDGDGRPCRQEARRRADVAVRLSGGAGERCRARGAGGAGDPARACRFEPQERRLGQAGAQCPHRSRNRSRWSWMRRARFSATSPNVAARVQALAEPGAVLVTARVQRQVAGLFVAEERGRHQLKGVPEPVTLFQLVRASGGGRRSAQRNLTPLVGRDEEISDADAALGAGAAGRRPAGADRRRAGLR